jgi:hypothetical protein
MTHERGCKVVMMELTMSQSGLRVAFGKKSLYGMAFERRLRRGALSQLS